MPTWGIAGISFAALTGTSSLAAGTVPSDRPLPRNARVLRTSEFSFGPTPQESDISVPANGIFTLDYMVDDGQQVHTLMLTDAQYKEAAQGRTPKPPLLLDIWAKGSGSQSAALTRGTYHIVWLGDVGTRLAYRGWWMAEQ